MKKRTLRAQPATADAPLYQLKITLKWSKPPIWRRVVVRADMKLDRLHDVIQIAMGWMDCHLHQFIAAMGSPRSCYGRTDLEFADMDGEMLSESRHTVVDLAPAAKNKFIYEYDFGDNWQHEVTVEKILPPDATSKHPVCLAGANAAPPEDCGGIVGYYDMLEILADPEHSEHEEMKEWIGEEWDAAAFSPEYINKALKRLKV